MWINDNCPHGNFPSNFTALNRNHFHWIVGCHFFWNTSLLHGLWLLYIRKSLFQSILEIQHTCSYIQFSHSVMSDCLWPHRPACQDSLSITNSQSLLKLMSIESVLPSNHLILSSPSPPAFNLDQHQGLFKWVSSLHQVAKVLEFQF